MYGKIRAALVKAEPKEVATLVKQGDLILERISLLDGGAPATGGPQTGGDELDDFTRRREERAATA